MIRIYETATGYVLADRAGWVPGVYASPGLALVAAEQAGRSADEPARMIPDDPGSDRTMLEMIDQFVRIMRHVNALERELGDVRRALQEQR